MIQSPQTLSTIDPTEGLIQYVQAVKPYHTKVLEVLVEYVYTENLAVTIVDSVVFELVGEPAMLGKVVLPVQMGVDYLLPGDIH
jgi:hypothetical protein